MSKDKGTDPKNEPQKQKSDFPEPPEGYMWVSKTEVELQKFQLDNLRKSVKEAHKAGRKLQKDLTRSQRDLLLINLFERVVTILEKKFGVDPPEDEKPQK
jgi:hypothetical protein